MPFAELEDSNDIDDCCCCCCSSSANSTEKTKKKKHLGVILFPHMLPTQIRKYLFIGWLTPRRIPYLHSLYKKDQTGELNLDKFW